MLTGWVCLYLFLVYVLTHGGKIQGWHAAVWIVATFVGTFLVAGGKREVEGGKIPEDGEQMSDGRCQKTEASQQGSVAGGRWSVAMSQWSVIGGRWVVAGLLTGVGLALPLLFSWILSHFTDFSWDGMTSRGITVRNLMKGDPALNAYPFGHVLAGFLAHVTGSWQGGKGINLTLIWICFCFVVPAFQSIGFAGWKLWFLSVVTALNPVAVYQISCFQIDGHVASLVTCLLFSMMRILASGPIRLDGVLALVAAFVGCAASKTSGVFYAIIIDGIFLFFLAGLSRSWKRVLLLFAVALGVSWPLGVYIRSIGQFAPLDLQYLRTSTRIETPGFGVGSGASHAEALKKLDRIQQFIVSSCSYTEIMPKEIRLKPPFWMQRRELRAVEELTPDPRAGGFGPLFSTGLMLAGVVCIILTMRGCITYWPGWFLFLATVASSFGSQVWWARWTPQNWLPLIAMLMTVLAFRFKGSKAQEEEGVKVERDRLRKVVEMGIKGLAGLACVATAINVFLVTLYYLVGMVKQERILNHQIELAAVLASPVPIRIEVLRGGHYDGASFLASEWWFVDRGVPVTKLAEKPRRPRMKIHKTETWVPLTPDWPSHLKNPKDEQIFRMKGLIEE